ncbi:MAG: PAS domain S-box protein [Planctomycetaceae bacterium]|nr:PAS domain S-box protein [Planctomycetales bacterium]MCB9937450.1 PAS domain S-box protein [Planctomycetaceae bacterium]
MAVLKATRGLAPGTICKLQSEPTVVGRNPKVCDIVLEHFAVSREHARIETIDRTRYVQDLDSRNGVLINGKVIKPGREGRQRLYPGDRIEIAAFEFIYDEDPSTDDLVFMADDTARPGILSTIECSADSSRSSGSGARPDKLHTLVGIIEDLSHELDLERVLPKIIASLFRAFPQTQTGCVLLRDKAGQLVPVAAQVPRGTQGPMRISRTIVDEVVQQRRAILACSTGTDSSTGDGDIAEETLRSSVISAPLLNGANDVSGVIQLEIANETEQFTHSDLELLGAVARHLAVVIENSRFHDSALREQRSNFEARFRKLIEGSIQGILIHRLFKPLFVNEAWAALHGYTAKEVLAMESTMPLIAPHERERAMQFALARMRGDDVPPRYEAQHLRQDGSTVWVEKFISVIEWDGQPAVQTALIDLSQRKATEAALQHAHDDLERRVHERTAELAAANYQLQAEILERRQAEVELGESESLYHSLVDHIPLCVARKDTEGKFTFVNKALCTLFRMKPEQVIGKTDYDLFAPEAAETHRSLDAKVASTGELAEVFETVRLPGGLEFDIHTIKTPIYGCEDEVIGTQLLFWDITAQKKTEGERNRYAAELERSNRDLEQFAYSVSHDLQAPLRTIASYCQLLQRRYAGQFDADADEFLEGAVEGARRMKRLLDDLLAYSRVTTDKHPFSETDCNVVLAEARNNLELQLRESGAELTSDALPVVVGNRSQLMQLFQNLVGNAIAYRSDQPPQIHVSAKECDAEWTFCVKDNGVGIEERQYERIFQIFQRLFAEHERPGSGVGLSICKRIVERHHGRMWLVSEPGKGSEFYFTIAKPPEQAKQPTKAE